MIAEGLAISIVGYISYIAQVSVDKNLYLQLNIDKYD